MVRPNVNRIAAGVPNSFVRGSTFGGATGTGIGLVGSDVKYIEISGNTMTLSDAPHRVGMDLASVSHQGATEIDIKNNVITAYEGITADDTLGGTASPQCLPGGANYATSCGIRITGNTLTAVFQSTAPPAPNGTILPRGISVYGLHSTGYAVISENRITGFNEGIVVGHRKTGAYPYTPSLFNNVFVDNQVGVYVMRSKNPAHLTTVSAPSFLAVLLNVVHGTFFNNGTGIRVQPEYFMGNGVNVLVTTRNNIFTSTTSRPEAVSSSGLTGDANVFFNYVYPRQLSIGPFPTTRGNVFATDPMLVTTAGDPRLYALPAGSAFCTGGRLTNGIPPALYTSIDILGATRTPTSPSLGAFQCP
jgi:hypothetical protein